MTATVRNVKDFRRKIPANGREYFARRCLTAEGREKFSNHWPWEISFNYLGQYQQLERSDALLKPLESMAGETREAGGTADVGHNAPRFGLFELSAIIFKGQLKFAFTFNRHMQHQDKIAQWVSECERTFSGTVQALAALAPTSTLSDFPLLSLTQESFQSMLGRLADVGLSTADIEDIYPCSSMQDGLLLSQTKDAGFYAAVTVHELVTPGKEANPKQLAEAWDQVVRRHPALRTVFIENLSGDDDLYNQVVLKHHEAHVVRQDCTTEEEALSYLERQRSVTYDNGRSPPHRFTICTISAGRVYFSL